MKYVTLGKICKYTDFFWYVFSVYLLRFCPYIAKFGLERTFIFSYLKQCPTESIGKLRYYVRLHCTCKILRISNFNKLPALYRTEIFKNSFLPYTINEWNKLDPEIRRIDLFKKSFIKLTENKIFSIYNSLGIKRLNAFSPGSQKIRFLRFQ